MQHDNADAPRVKGRMRFDPTINTDWQEESSIVLL